jgi:hypothetical protein
LQHGPLSLMAFCTIGFSGALVILLVRLPEVLVT